MKIIHHEFTQLSVTLPSSLYTLLISTFEISNQDDLDQCIQSFIEDRLDNKQHLSLKEPIDKLLTPEQVSQILGIKIESLANSRHMKTGLNIPYVKLGHLVRYKESAIKTYIENSKVNPQDNNE